MSKENYLEKLLVTYSNTAVLIGLIGIVFVTLNLSLFNDYLFKYGTRFNGLMNDPNYFAILQTIALSYFIKKDNLDERYRLLSIAILFFSIILSGSKTGLLTLGVYLSFLFIERVTLKTRRMSLKKIIRNIILLGVFCLTIIILANNFSNIIYWLNKHIPSSIRITNLFTDFETAISTGGSSRDTAWNAGIEIVRDSPLFGVGVSNYTTIISKYMNTEVIAHNTYIQLAAEWGLPITVVFFSGIIMAIVSILLNKDSNLNLNILKDILIIFLIGSMGISLNNARFFWIILGSTFTTLKYYKQVNYER